MEIRRLDEPQLTDKQLRNIMFYGLIIDSILIIFSVDTFFKEGKYLELIISTIVFGVILFLIRKLNSKQ